MGYACMCVRGAARGVTSEILAGGAMLDRYDDKIPRDVLVVIVG